MNPGYVYIFINESMPGLIKIGKTRRDSRARAREIYKTGVPTPYQVAFELFCDDYEAVEHKAHDHLADFRVNSSREFFRYPLDKAINILQSLAADKQTVDTFEAIDITSELKARYAHWMKIDIVSVRIVQPGGRVWLEITEEHEYSGQLVDQTVKRSDLGFITDGDEQHLFFSPGDDVRENANKFVNDFCPFSIINTTDLFHDEGAEEVNKKYNPHMA